jgi:hypothetical protein
MELIRIRMIIAAIVSPVVVGVITAKMFMSDPIIRFNEAICEVYKDRCVYIRS